VSINPIHKILNKDIASANAPQYRMSISVRIDGLSLLILHENDIVLAHNYHWHNADWKTCAANIHNIINGNSFFTFSYKSVDVFMENQQTMLIPNEFFNDYAKQGILNEYIASDEFVAKANKLKSESAHLVFGIQKDLSIILNKSLPKAIYHHSSVQFIDNVLKAKDSSKVISLIVKTNYFESIASEGNKLLAHNFFNYKSKDEFMFLLLSFINQQGFDAKDIKLVLCDDLIKTSPIAKELALFFNNIKEYNRENTNEKEVVFTTLKNNTIVANS